MYFVFIISIIIIIQFSHSGASGWFPRTDPYQTHNYLLTNAWIFQCDPEKGECMRMKR